MYKYSLTGGEGDGFKRGGRKKKGGGAVTLLDIMPYLLAAHRLYLAVCFGSVSFSVPPSLRFFILQRVCRFAAPLVCIVLVVQLWWLFASGSALGLAAPL